MKNVRFFFFFFNLVSFFFQLEVKCSIYLNRRFCNVCNGGKSTKCIKSLFGLAAFPSKADAVTI